MDLLDWQASLITFAPSASGLPEWLTRRLYLLLGGDTVAFASVRVGAVDEKVDVLVYTAQLFAACTATGLPPSDPFYNDETDGGRIDITVHRRAALHRIESRSVDGSNLDVNNAWLRSTSWPRGVELNLHYATLIEPVTVRSTDARTFDEFYGNLLRDLAAA